jgi:hypothetical protein
MKSFEAERDLSSSKPQRAALQPLCAPAARPTFISAVAFHLMLVQGGRLAVANAAVRKRAASLIDKLLDLRDRGASPPLIGFVHRPDGEAGLVFLSDELDKWRKQLRSPLPAGRRRGVRNDAHVRHRLAMSAFRDCIERNFGSPCVAGILAERFAALIGYRNPSAQASR